MPRRVILLCGLLAALLLPALAHASTRQGSLLMDNRLLEGGTTAQRNDALDRAKALGVDQIHALVGWSRTAGGDFSSYDALVDGARARHMSVLLTLTTPAPDSASECPRGTPRRNVCKPSVKKFEAWVRTVGNHFRGRVSHWSVLNEPNLDGWLAPHYAKSHGRRYLFAARRYRDLFRAATRALAATGHAHDQVLLGETSPVASSRAVAPLSFLRAVFCLDGHNRALKGGEATRLGCTGFKRLAASGLAHHPYTPAAACSPVCKGGPQDVTIASLGRLNPVLDAAARLHRIPGAAAKRIYITEFGFQSNPPNRGGVISLAQQARYLNWSEEIAYHNPRVRLFGQYELDDPVPLNTVFNTGLAFGSGRHKPAWAAWRTPILVSRGRGGFVRVWGGVRPGGAHTVKIESATGRAFRVVRTVRTNPSGYLDVRLRARGAKRWRLVSGANTSRIAAAQ